MSDNLFGREFERMLAMGVGCAAGLILLAGILIGAGAVGLALYLR